MAISPATAAVLTHMAKNIAEEPVRNHRGRTITMSREGTLAYRLLDTLREAGEAGIDIGQAMALAHEADTK